MLKYLFDIQFNKVMHRQWAGKGNLNLIAHLYILQILTWLM